MTDLRKSGIDFLGDIPWGTHLCQFHETKADLLSILVPYFKAGLDAHEFCFWITSPPLSVDDAKKALAKAIPNLDDYLRKGQLEIVPHSQWYIEDGEFRPDRVLRAWLPSSTTYWALATTG